MKKLFEAAAVIIGAAAVSALCVAASMGVFIHGYAGNLAAQKHGEYGLTAGDIIDCIGQAIKEIMQ